jgi:hypothetical protein
MCGNNLKEVNGENRIFQNLENGEAIKQVKNMF